MAQETDWTKLDDLLGLREWLKGLSEEELARAAPGTTPSRPKMLAKLDELIAMCRKQKASGSA